MDTSTNRFLPSERIETDFPGQEYMDHITDTRWWSFAQKSEEDTFLMYLDDALSFVQCDNKLQHLRDTNQGDVEKALRIYLDVFKRARDILLSIGGYATVFPNPTDRDMFDLVEKGRFWPGKSKMVHGRHNRCHSNACKIWADRDGNDVFICTGYALSADGLWREHSWVLKKYKTPGGKDRERIIETTVKRVAYFGVALTGEDAERFYESNI